MTTAGGSLAVILGASEWPNFPNFETRPAFQNSANFFRDYLLRDEGLGLPAENLLWLFDNEEHPGAIVDRISRFLRTNAEAAIRNILFFYVGHGGYLNKDYFVALRCTSQKNLDLTVLPVKFIAKTLYEETPHKRHIVIIDACYASGAVTPFIYQDAGIAVVEVPRQIREVLSEVDIDKGSALFCAAGPKSKSKAPWEGEYTMFSGALQRVLSTGDPTFQDYLSLEEVAGLVEKDIFNTFRAEAVRPELHTPRQEKGDLRTLRLFPNPARRKELESRSVRKLRDDVDGLTNVVSELRKELNETRDSILAATTNQRASFRQIQDELKAAVQAWLESAEGRLAKRTDELEAKASEALKASAESWLASAGEWLAERTKEPEAKIASESLNLRSEKRSYLEIRNEYLRFVLAGAAGSLLPVIMLLTSSSFGSNAAFFLIVVALVAGTIAGSTRRRLDTAPATTFSPNARRRIGRFFTVVLSSVVTLPLNALGNSGEVALTLSTLSAIGMFIAFTLVEWRDSTKEAA